MEDLDAGGEGRIGNLPKCDASGRKREVGKKASASILSMHDIVYFRKLWTYGSIFAP